MEVIEEILIHYYSDTPINITVGLAMAAINDNIHLNCVYFLLRREPDILFKLLSSTPVQKWQIQRLVGVPTTIGMMMMIMIICCKNVEYKETKEIIIEQ